MKDEIRLSAGSDERSRIELLAWLTGDGIVVFLRGGERPHVGAVVMAVPRPSLSDEGQESCNSWVLPVLGHKDDEIARPAAETIATSTGQVTVVAAGIHIRDAGVKEISQVETNCRQLVLKFLEQISSY